MFFLRYTQGIRQQGTDISDNEEAEGQSLRNEEKKKLSLVHVQYSASSHI